VDGWEVVVKKGEFEADDLAIYIEIDSWVPHKVAPFLCKSTVPREYEGVEGERLKTVRLRGQISQGLLLPLVATLRKTKAEIGVEGDDLTELLGIRKWERPIPSHLSGQVRGNFPSFLPKTDQPRIQNLRDKDYLDPTVTWEVTEKLDGASCTIWFGKDGDFRVCSRNMDLKRDVANDFWRMAIRDGVEEKMKAHWVDMVNAYVGYDRYAVNYDGKVLYHRDLGKAYDNPADIQFVGYALQGELIGPGIQGNKYHVSLPEFYVFDVIVVTGVPGETAHRYLSPSYRKFLVERLGLKHVPVLVRHWTNSDNGNEGTFDLKELLAGAAGKSKLCNCEREGLVYKTSYVRPAGEVGRRSFKIINNKFLLKNDE
jgi:RNA ligase (TIGR02306 family)